jgi:hypothetical protein
MHLNLPATGSNVTKSTLALPLVSAAAIPADRARAKTPPKAPASAVPRLTASCSAGPVLGRIGQLSPFRQDGPPLGGRQRSGEPIGQAVGRAWRTRQSGRRCASVARCRRRRNRHSGKQAAMPQIADRRARLRKELPAQSSSRVGTESPEFRPAHARRRPRSPTTDRKSGRSASTHRNVGGIKKGSRAGSLCFSTCGNVPTRAGATSRSSKAALTAQKSPARFPARAF